MKKILLLSVLLIIGCSKPDFIKMPNLKLTNSGIVKLSQDTYMLRREDHGGYLARSSLLKVSVIRDANEFANKQGKVAIKISSHATPMDKSQNQWPSFEYKFRVADEKVSEVRRTPQIQRNDTNTIVETNNPTGIYNELIQLDDLRKKGIITDKEFQDQKTKILNRY